MPDYKRKKRNHFTAKPKADKTKFAVKGEKKIKYGLKKMLQLLKEKNRLTF